MQAQLKDAQDDLAQATALHEAAISSIETAIRAKEEIHAKIEQKKNDLEITLDADLDWSGIAVPDNVLERLRLSNYPKAQSLYATGKPAGGCEDSVEGKSENSGRHGQDNTGR